MLMVGPFLIVIQPLAIAALASRSREEKNARMMECLVTEGIIEGLLGPSQAIPVSEDAYRNGATTPADAAGSSSQS
jgi:hypothetical protein